MAERNGKERSFHGNRIDDSDIIRTSLLVSELSNRMDIAPYPCMVSRVHRVLIFRANPHKGIVFTFCDTDYSDMARVFLVVLHDIVGCIVKEKVLKGV